MAQLTTDDFYTEIQNAAQTAAPLFQMYGWTYGAVPGNGVPNIHQLVDCIEQLAQHALRSFNEQVANGEESPEASVASGRFVVRIKEWEDEREFEVTLELSSKSQFKDWTF